MIGEEGIQIPVEQPNYIVAAFGSRPFPDFMPIDKF